MEGEGASLKQSLRARAMPFLSVVVPVFNEAGVVSTFLDELGSTLLKAQLSYELVFVDDGSTDGTLDELIARTRGGEHLRVISLSRNFGKEAALTAGFDHAKGDVIIPMDVDLQDSPELILKFVDFWREGYDVVYGIREKRAGDPTAKRITASIFYRIFNLISDIKIPEDVGDFRLIDRRVVEAIRQCPERNRFMKGLFAWAGFRSIGVPYERAARKEGESKWRYWRLWNFAIDGIVSFSTAPLRVWTYIGASIALMALAYALYRVILVLTIGVDVPGYASLITAILFMGGMQLLSLGLIGEYLSRVFTEVKSRPIYIIDAEYPKNDAPKPRSAQCL
jgi:polyisoprenyl-phosphate glycosyltransferase